MSPIRGPTPAPSPYGGSGCRFRPPTGSFAGIRRRPPPDPGRSAPRVATGPTQEESSVATGGNRPNTGRIVCCHRWQRGKRRKNDRLPPVATDLTQEKLSAATGEVRDFQGRTGLLSSQGRLGNGSFGLVCESIRFPGGELGLLGHPDRHRTEVSGFRTPSLGAVCRRPVPKASRPECATPERPPNPRFPGAEDLSPERRNPLRRRRRFDPSPQQLQQRPNQPPRRRARRRRPPPAVDLHADRWPIPATAHHGGDGGGTPRGGAHSVRCISRRGDGRPWRRSASRCRT